MGGIAASVVGRYHLLCPMRLTRLRPMRGFAFWLLERGRDRREEELCIRPSGRLRNMGLFPVSVSVLTLGVPGASIEAIVSCDLSLRDGSLLSNGRAEMGRVGF